MEDIGKSSRRNFIFQRKHQLSWLFSQSNRDAEYPIPTQPYGDYGNLPMLPPHVELLAIESEDDVTDYKQRPDTIDVLLPALKPRYIDPVYINSRGNYSRLSQADQRFRKLLKQQREISAQSYIARIHLNPDTREIIADGISENEVKWGEALERPRMGNSEFKRMLGEIAMVGANHRLVTVDFMDFESINRFLVR
jgi:hypothetical protein